MNGCQHKLRSHYTFVGHYVLKVLENVCTPTGRGYICSTVYSQGANHVQQCTIGQKSCTPMYMEASYLYSHHVHQETASLSCTPIYVVQAGKKGLYFHLFEHTQLRTQVSCTRGQVHQVSGYTVGTVLWVLHSWLADTLVRHPCTVQQKLKQYIHYTSVYSWQEELHYCHL